VYRINGKKFTVVPNRQAAADVFLPGASGAAGLSGHIHRYYRGKTKQSTTCDEQPLRTPDSMVNNPFYFKSREKAKEKKDLHVTVVPWAVRDICRAILQNPAESKLFAEVLPLLRVYTILTTSAAECERGVSLLKLIKTALRNRLSQATLEQLLMIKINGANARLFDFALAVKVFFSKKDRKFLVPWDQRNATPSDYVWGDVFGEEEQVVNSDEEEDMTLDGEDDGVSSEEDVQASVQDRQSRILTGSAPNNATNTNRQKLEAAAERKRKAAERKIAEENRRSALLPSARLAEDNAKKAQRKVRAQRRQALNNLQNLEAMLPAGKAARNRMPSERALTAHVDRMPSSPQAATGNRQKHDGSAKTKPRAAAGKAKKKQKKNGSSASPRQAVTGKRNRDGSAKAKPKAAAGKAKKKLKKNGSKEANQRTKKKR
jgi:hypothetical protein